MSWTRRILIGLVAILMLLVLAVRLTTFHPRSRQAEDVTCPADTAALQPGQPVKIMSWNVQYMAGKDYVFWYDLFDDSGPDERPSTQAIAATFDGRPGTGRA